MTAQTASASKASKCSWLLFLSLTFTMGCAAHASELLVDTSMSRIELNRALQYYEDKTGELSINDIASQPMQDKFRFAQDGNVNFGLSKSVYWVRLQLRQESTSANDWLLEIPYTHLRYVSLYTPTTTSAGEMPYHAQSAGFSIPFTDRALKYRQSTFKLTLGGSNPAQTLYLRIQSNGPIWIPLTLWQPHTFAEHQATESYVLGIYFGLIFGMLFYNAFLYGTLRDTAYLHYVLYAGSVAILFASITGFTYQYLWPDYPKFAYFSPTIWTSCAAFFLTLFTRTFLGTKANMPGADKLIRFLILYWGISTLPLFLVQFYFGIGYFVYQVAAFLTMFCFLILGFVALRRGFAPARFYVLSFFAFLVGGLAFILRNAGLLPANYLTTYGVIFGSAVEVILLATALADRINILKKEKESAQLEVVKNKEYAVQVLQHANQALLQEIERRMQTEASLFESREKYRALFENLPVGVVVTDSRGKVVETNHASIGGIEPSMSPMHSDKGRFQLVSMSGVPLKKRDHPVFRSLKSGETIANMEIGVVPAASDDRSEPARWFSVTAAPMSMAGYGVIATYIDITERIHLELQRRQQQVELARASRFNTMGEMASALAHEINQPLGSTLNYLYGIIHRLESGHADLAEIRDGITLSIKQIERAGGVIKHIHNFTRHHTPQVKTINLNELIKNIITFAEVDFRRFKTQLQLKLTKASLPVDINEIEMGQVILNLIKNGMDAMRDLNPEERILTIQTEDNVSHATVTVHDQGPGISAENREKIFDAFFTTKHDSLGLGLCVSRTIVQSHNGKISVQENRNGASFQVVLPMSIPT
jgi:signal transduction histidine kinase/PAS domain-containing protein